jgi:hypothetical protein
MQPTSGVQYNLESSAVTDRQAGRKSEEAKHHASQLACFLWSVNAYHDTILIDRTERIVILRFFENRKVEVQVRTLRVKVTFFGSLFHFCIPFLRSEPWHRRDHTSAISVIFKTCQNKTVKH